MAPGDLVLYLFQPKWLNRSPQTRGIHRCHPTAVRFFFQDQPHQPVVETPQQPSLTGYHTPSLWLLSIQFLSLWGGIPGIWRTSLYPVVNHMHVTLLLNPPVSPPLPAAAFYGPRPAPCANRDVAGWLRLRADHGKKMSQAVHWGGDGYLPP